jgi:hypothetical protein
MPAEASMPQPFKFWLGLSPHCAHRTSQVAHLVVSTIQFGKVGHEYGYHARNGTPCPSRCMHVQASRLQSSSRLGENGGSRNTSVGEPTSIARSKPSDFRKLTRTFSETGSALAGSHACSTTSDVSASSTLTACARAASRLATNTHLPGTDRGRPKVQRPTDRENRTRASQRRDQPLLSTLPHHSGRVSGHQNVIQHTQPSRQRRLHRRRPARRRASTRRLESPLFESGCNSSRLLAES